MSEYIIKGTSLTNIADGIRSVDGSSSTLTPAQMQARLTAVKSSIDAAFSALAAKEVTVPSGSTVHKLAELIASIEAGGGLPDGVSAITTGVYIPASNVKTSQIEHGLDVVPNFFFMKCTPKVSPSLDCVVVGYASYDKYCFGQGYRRGSYYYGGIDYSNSLFTSSAVTVNAPTLGDKTDHYIAYFASGAEYHWIAGVFA